jgi:SH3-like domain-containing protein
MGAEEFKNENYGGALYLTNQAKAHIKAGQLRLRTGQSTSAVHKGETPFPQPLELKLLQRANLRQDPASKAKILRTIEKGTQILGYSTVGAWIRVGSEDGSMGWVLRSA